ncbi:MAG: protein translocase subunit SecF [Actinomycetota bacterium]
MTTVFRRSQIDFVGRARTWFLLSGILLLVSIASLGFRQLNAGLEFRGGTSFQVEAAAKDVDVDDVREAVERVGVEHSSFQEIGERGFLVQTSHLSPSDQADAIEEIAEVTGVDTNDVNVTDVGPKWGAQITSKAIQALGFFLVVAVVYLSIRLEPKMAFAGLVALLHDMVATAGIYSLTGFEVTPATVIALLTILGYSLYDTVVIFDRVKDRTVSLSASGRVTYSQATNGALNEVLLRSINTTVVSLLPVGSLLFVGSFLLGAQTLRELALALFVGLALGAYSSVFVATPILALWKEREDRWSSLRARIGARQDLSTPPSRPAPAAAPTPPQPQATAVATAPPAQAWSPPSSQPRPGGGGGAPKTRRRKRKKRKHGR